MFGWFRFCCFFFKQKTAYEMRISDWSSDVCSSDLSLLSLIRIPSSPQYPYNTFVRDKTTAHTALVPEGASQDHPPSVSVSFQALPYQDAKRSHFSYLRHAHFQSEPCCP